MTTAQRVLILTSDTGGGHTSAARALESSLTHLTGGELLIRMTRVLEEAHDISRAMGQVYNYLLRNHQDYMKYYYWVIERVKPNESPWLFKQFLPYAQRLFDRFCPDMIVSVHPMVQHFYAHVLKTLKLSDRIPMVTVVTDPCAGFWKGWACDAVSKYYVASIEAKDQLMHYGVPESIIDVKGMPVHPRFQPIGADARLLLRQELGLAPDKFTVFLNSGWVGGGNVPRIAEMLAASNLDVQMVFLTGKNRGLREKGMDLQRKANFPVHVLGYTREMERWMNASDVMVTKLGGLTTFEAMACELPILADTITPPMPQEVQTAHYIERTKTGILLKKPSDIVPVVHSLIESPKRYEALRVAACEHSHRDASHRIAEDVLSSLSIQGAS